ncbi:MAG: Gfo/Idh/MocA family oxidoreductase [Erythrobacter sp.]|uniref:Gfo/Idh/MocA family protein n=1 Tax=Erythrobacter sp. TaxID=1042 RepID=UPI002612536F|nr:Gfo/Idh/MocA family oxidoreductase [Erythrobacter sp.]MDJ0979214.1 Gfo/Idh/MocA family oxidoreductase [Erythrobacter sp.]
METRSYAIIGCGMMGREHMRNMALVEGADLVAVADPDAGSRTLAQAEARALGLDVRVFEDSAALLAEAKPDAVIIASPNFTHFDVAGPVMEAGCAVLMEKPMCTTLADAEALERAVRAYDRLFWVGLEYRYMPPATRFIERVHAGEAGAIKMLAIREHRFPFLTKVGDWNRFNRNTGGTLVEKCCHFFDLMRHILRDEPVRVFASGAQDVNHLEERYDGEAPDILDNAFVVVDFAGGARAVLDLCMFAEGSEEQEEISAVGPVGKLEVKLPGGFVTWSPRDKSGPHCEHVAVPAKALEAGSHHGATYYQLRDFHAALTSGAEPRITARDGYRSVVMGAAAQESIATGMPVAIDFKDED